MVAFLLGNDLVYIPRVARMIERYGENFLWRVLREDEIQYCKTHSGQRKPLENMVAARLAVKESVAKALKTGLNGLGYGEGIAWKDIQICSRYQEAPTLNLHGRAKQCGEEQKISSWEISWSHDEAYAMATVIAW